jgi:hypothetical protein
MVQDWATREDQRRSYELLARHVMPRYTGALFGVEAGHRQGVAYRARAEEAMKNAIEKAFEDRARQAVDI